MGSLPGLALLVLSQELEEFVGGTDGPLAPARDLAFFVSRRVLIFLGQKPGACVRSGLRSRACSGAAAGRAVRG